MAKYYTDEIISHREKVRSDFNFLLGGEYYTNEEVNFYQNGVIEPDHCAFWHAEFGWMYTNPNINSGTAFNVTVEKLVNIIMSYLDPETDNEVRIESGIEEIDIQTPLTVVLITMAFVGISRNYQAMIPAMSYGKVCQTADKLGWDDVRIVPANDLENSVNRLKFWKMDLSNEEIMSAKWNRPLVYPEGTELALEVEIYNYLSAPFFKGETDFE